MQPALFKFEKSYKKLKVKQKKQFSYEKRPCRFTALSVYVGKAMFYNPSHQRGHSRPLYERALLFNEEGSYHLLDLEISSLTGFLFRVLILVKERIV